MFAHVINPKTTVPWKKNHVPFQSNALYYGLITGAAMIVFSLDPVHCWIFI